MTKFFLFIFMMVLSKPLWATCTVGLQISDTIGAATLDYLQRAEKFAQEKNCDSFFLKINTPGGNLQSTRLIVESILASKRAYLCLIAPSGAHAGSAGAIIMQACHVNGGLAATNIGAATPITLGGEKMPEDLRKKMINDTTSWVVGLAQLRGRNVQFAKDIVVEAKSVSVEQAVKEKAVDILAQNEIDFLEQAKARGLAQNIFTNNIQLFEPDFRYRVLNLIADPELAYLMFMGSIALLYVEVTHPGAIAPGVIGGIGFVLSLVAFHKLEVAWAGILLILLGVIFGVAEIFVPSFGALGVGGIISLFVGSLFLFDNNMAGYSLSIPLIISVVGTLALIFLGVGYLASKTLNLKTQDNDSDLFEHMGIVKKVEENRKSGQLEVLGEIWAFSCDNEVNENDQVQIYSRDGLKLKVRKK